MRVKHIETKNQLQFLGWLLRPLLFTGQTVNIQTFPVPRFVARNCGALFGKFGCYQHLARSNGMMLARCLVLRT